MNRTFSKKQSLSNSMMLCYLRNFSRKTNQTAISLQVDAAFLISTSDTHNSRSVLIYTCKELIE